MVYFHNQTKFKQDAEEVFLQEKKKILRIVPNADIQHIGSTAIPGSLTKGDLDIQVRIAEKDFEQARKAISKLYKPNKGNPPTKTYASFKDDSAKVPLGVQLIVIGAKEDNFLALRDILLHDKEYLKEYNTMKRRYQGKPMREYRKAKGKFIEKVLKTKAKKTNCIVIHGCPSNVEKAMSPETRTYDKHWIPWIKKELTAKGIKTETPLMPSPWEPDYEKFKKEFEKYEVSENSILIGHSCGCAFLVRWLGEMKQKIFKLILVAPWKIPDKNDRFRKAFYEYPIDETIKSRVKEIVMFTADDEANDGKESLKIFHQALGGKIIELKGKGHYTMGDMQTTEFSELLKIVLSATHRS